MFGKSKNNMKNSIIVNNAGFVDLEKQPKNKKRNIFLIVFPILIFFLFSGICFGGYYYYENYVVESAQSKFMNHMKKINIDTILDSDLYSQISNKNTNTVHNTTANLSIKTKKTQEEDESVANKLTYNLDLFSNPQGEEKYLKLGIDYSDNNISNIEAIEKGKDMALYCPDILDEYVVWEKENTAYYMSKISSVRSKFDYNQIYELFAAKSADLSLDYKHQLFEKALKIVDKNTKKANYEEKSNVTFTNEDGESIDCIGYKLNLKASEYNKVFFEIVKALRDDSELLNKITQDENVSDTEIESNNIIYKILESIITEKRINISSSKLENILDSKMIEIENSINQDDVNFSIYVLEDKVKFLIFNNGEQYIRCDFLEDSSIKLTVLVDEMPNYTDGTIKSINTNFNEGKAFIDKALEGDYIAPIEENEEVEETQEMQPGTLRSIRVVENEEDDNADDNSNNNDTTSTEEVNLSTNTAQNVDNTVTVSEQTTANPSSNANSNNGGANSNANPNNGGTSSGQSNRPTSIDGSNGGTVTIGEQGQVNLRNAPKEIYVAVNSDGTLSREDIIENSKVGEVDFSVSEEEESLREEEIDIDNAPEDLEKEFTNTELYNSTDDVSADKKQSNGFTLIIKSQNQNANNTLKIEYDEIKNSQISSKYIIDMNMNGTANSTEFKNDIAINYYDNSCQKLINLKYTTKYGDNTVEVPDISTNNYVLDELEEDEFNNGIAQIRGFILKYIKLKKNQWELITKNR